MSASRIARTAGGRAERALDDGGLLGGARVADDDLHHEPVDLGLGQRVGALGLDRVLGRHDEERARDGVALAADRDLALLHDLEQRGLDLGRRAVDLVGEQEVAEHRAELGVEGAGRRAVDPGPDEVARGRGPGVNWIRRNEASRASARVLIVSVLARPGTPSRSRWPPASRATSTRSSIASWPTMTRRISNRTASAAMRGSSCRAVGSDGRASRTGSIIGSLRCPPWRACLRLGRWGALLSTATGDSRCFGRLMRVR